MRLCRKGIIFTILALLLVGILELTVILFYTSPSRQESTIAEFDTLNSFVNDLETTLLPRILVSSAYSGLSHLSREMTGFVDLKNSDSLQKLLKGEPVGGVVWADPERLLWKPGEPEKGALGKLRLTSLEQLPIRKLEFSNVHSIKVSMLDSWTAIVEMKVDYTLEAISGTMNWTRTNVPVSAKMSLIGLEDPFVRLCTASPGIRRVFNQTSISPDELPNNWTQSQYISFFEAIAEKGLYVSKKTAPDILDRFNGDNRKSEFGVYSIIAEPWGRNGFMDVGDPYSDYCLIGTPVSASSNVNTGVAPAKCSELSSALYREMCGNPETGNAVTDEIAGLTKPEWQTKIRLDARERVRFHLEPSGDRCVFQDSRWVNPGTTPPTDCN